MQRRTYHFSGRVQGVGFRYTAHNIAQRHNVRGYVRNLPDGRVELVLEGADREMDLVMADIQSRLSDCIGDVTMQAAPATGEFAHFTIRH